ncbi:MAG: NosD domain-containing protein [Promethearchaeota archaeon]
MIFLVSSFSTPKFASNGDLKDLNKSPSLISSKTVRSTFFTTPHNSIEVSNDIELAATAVSGSGTDSDPYVLEGWNITTTRTHGIYIHGTSAYFIIRYCWVDTGNVWGMHGIYINNVAAGTATILNNINQNNAAGIHIRFSPSSYVANNVCLNNSNGISLYNSPSSFVVNNTCNNNRKNLVAGYFQIGLFTDRSTHLMVSNNNCHDNNRGIVLAYSDYSTLVNNFCNQNDVEGICLDESSSVIVDNNSCQNNDMGIFLWISHSSSVMDNILLSNNLGVKLQSSNFNNISANNISENEYGAYFIDSDNCIVKLNDFYKNNNYGCYLDSNSIDVYLVHNAFILNSYQITQAADDGSANRFIYNYWDDWASPDENDDGIVDNPYAIEGSADNQDPFPLINTPIYDIEENDFLIDYSDEFNSSNLDSKWSWIHEDPSHWSLIIHPGYLRISIQEGDIIADQNTIENVLLQDAPLGDFEIVTRLNFTPAELGANHAGLIIFQDEDNYIRLIRCYMEHFGNVILVNQEIDGNYYDKKYTEKSLNTTHLKISKEKNLYRTFYSLDGIYWIEIGSGFSQSLTDLKIGLIAFAVEGVEQDADFDYFHVFDKNPFSYTLFFTDSDGDGMNDGWEYINDLNPLINDASHDPDNDSLSNLEEYFHRTNPLNSDSDADKMPDGWEVRYNSDPLTDSTFDDPDDDDLINLHEYRYDTDPLDPDSDGDGLNDFSEVLVYYTDPNKVDSDGDGLSDYDEVEKFHTDPNDTDTDNDFFPDGDDRGWIGNPRVAWDNPLTRSLLLILLFGFTLLGIWAGYISYHLPKLQRDLELLFQQFQQYALQFQEYIIAIKNLEDLDEIEAVTEHVYQTFLSYENFYVFAQYLIIQKWLPPFLRPDLVDWEVIFNTMKNTYGEFQRTRLKRFEDKY